MHPAMSVIFFTVASGAGFGLFSLLYIADVFTLGGGFNREQLLIGGVMSLALIVLGLVSSTFHLANPKNAWRAFNRFRTSWLSREGVFAVIFMPLALAYLLCIWFDAPPLLRISIGFLAAVLAWITVFSTGMIYACIKFLREWATPLTLVNFTLLGCSSGFILAASYAGFAAPRLAHTYAMMAVLLTTVALITRTWSLQRNAELADTAKSTTQTAIGVKNPRVVQTSMGQMGGSFNTREFFHGKSDAVFTNIRLIFLVLVFPVPIALVWIGDENASAVALAVAFVFQYVGLLAERWFFFAQANHPQNLYYQKIS